MKAIRVLRLAIGQNQRALEDGRVPAHPPLSVLDTDTGEEQSAWQLLVNGPSVVRWSETAASPWAGKVDVHCWVETDAEVETL